jgi:hypothetical protein
MKKTILIILAAVLILTVACKNNPEVRNEVISDQVQWQDETVMTAEYTLNVDCVPNMYEAKVVEGSYSFFIRMDRVFCRAVTYSDALGPNDLSILDLTGNGNIYLYEGIMQYKQPDEGLGERDWTIKFYALMDSEDFEGMDKYMFVESPESEGSFGIPMYIYGAHGVKSLKNEDVEISDAELGFQSSLLNGWLSVEILDFEDKSEKETETRNGTIRTHNITHKYRFPQSFRLSIMDISGVSEETKKISSLPALNTRMMDEKFNLGY